MVTIAFLLIEDKETINVVYNKILQGNEFVFDSSKFNLQQTSFGKPLPANYRDNMTFVLWANRFWFFLTSTLTFKNTVGMLKILCYLSIFNVLKLH